MSYTHSQVKEKKGAIMRKLDQYGKRIPRKNLVVLIFPENFLNKSDIKTIMRARWYTTNQNVIFAPFDEIDGLTETQPIDAGIDIDKVELDRVAEPLKRYNEIDGFYYA